MLLDILLYGLLMIDANYAFIYLSILHGMASFYNGISDQQVAYDKPEGE